MQYTLAFTRELWSLLQNLNSFSEHGRLLRRVCKQGPADGHHILRSSKLNSTCGTIHCKATRQRCNLHDSQYVAYVFSGAHDFYCLAMTLKTLHLSIPCLIKSFDKQHDTDTHNLMLLETIACVSSTVELASAFGTERKISRRLKMSIQIQLSHHCRFPAVCG